MINETDINLSDLFSKREGCISVFESTVVSGLAASVDFWLSEDAAYAFSCSMYELSDRDEIGLLRLYQPKFNDLESARIRFTYDFVRKAYALTTHVNSEIYLSGLSIILADGRSIKFAAAHTPLHLEVFIDGEAVFGSMDFSIYGSHLIYSNESTA